MDGVRIFSGLKAMGERINADFPPFSRVFVVCSKEHKDEEIRKAFEQYGTVEDVWMVKDRMTKENKGICYVKFDKASSAALAIESLDGKTIGEEKKPIKVLIASAKNSPMRLDYTEESTRTRLFVVCPKNYSEEDLKKKFEHFGDLEYCNVVRDRQSGENKGFGYVKFSKASTAAIAMENCDRSLKAILAEPKPPKTQNSNHFPARGMLPRDQFMPTDGPSISPTHSIPDLSCHTDVLDASVGVRLVVIVSTSVTQEQLARLFDLVPGMEMCDLKVHPTGESKGYALVTFRSLQAAVYAKEKLNGFEYPPGQQMIVKYAEDPLPPPTIGPPSPTAEPVYSHPQYSSSTPISPLRSPLRPLSPVRPLVNHQRRHSFSSDFDSRVFFICQPHAPSEHILRDIFNRFGVLTDVWLVRGKNYGYAKFTNRGAAEAAITALHCMEVYGTVLKVMMADPPPESQQKRVCN